MDKNKKRPSYPQIVQTIGKMISENRSSYSLSLAYKNSEKGIWVYHGDSLKIMEFISSKHPEGTVDMIFADPPYFLSNGGITCQAGRMVRVDKGEWDKSKGIEQNHLFNLAWLGLCRKLLKPNGTIWITGTHHVIFSIGYAMQQLGFKILNDISWEKPNPPPNLSCRYFTHSTETVIWASKNEKSKHRFNYDIMKDLNNGKQMKTVWSIYPPQSSEKNLGRHPTQKPLALVERCILASTEKHDLVLDPFLGSGTTAIACARLSRKCIGIEAEEQYIQLSKSRLQTYNENSKTLFDAYSEI